MCPRPRPGHPTTSVALTAALYLSAALGLTLTSPAAYAQDRNLSQYQGNAYSVTWVENVEFNGVHTYDQVVASLYSYTPHPQLMEFGCLQSAKLHCITPGWLGCAAEAPLTITQLNPPAAYPVRVTRRCVDTSPAGGNCVRMTGYVNSAAGRSETTVAGNVQVLSYGECTAK